VAFEADGKGDRDIHDRSRARNEMSEERNSNQGRDGVLSTLTRRGILLVRLSSNPYLASSSS